MAASRPGTTGQAPPSQEPSFERPDPLALEEVGARLGRGEPVDDAVFDQVYPTALQDVSDYHWTPLAIVRRVLSLISPEAETRVLDVGSGVGKFCIAASLMARGRYTGVERQATRHEAALQARRQLGAEGAILLHGDAFDLDWSAYDVLYFYNPFQELISRFFGGPNDGLDYSAELRDHSVRAARSKLKELPDGALVVLYHGLGDDMPECYESAVSVTCVSGEVEVWVKAENRLRRQRGPRGTMAGAIPGVGP